MRRLNSEIYAEIERSNGIITTAQAAKLGFSKQSLASFMKDGLLVRVRHGVYMLPDGVHDDMYTLMLRSDCIVFSHETALFLNGLSDRTPFMHTVTLPSSRKLPGSLRDECECFYVKPSLHGIGLTQRKTTFGNTVRCYDAERTFCDFLKKNDRIDEETRIAAIKNYAAFEGKNLNRLAEYASALGVTAQVRNYLEVLL